MKRTLSLVALLLFMPIPATFADNVPSYVDLTDAPTITVDWSKGRTQAVTLHGNRTLLFTNGQKGEIYRLIIRQDATGSRAITWPSSVHWPGYTGQPQLTTTGNRKDYISFFCDGDNYDALGFAQNY